MVDNGIHRVADSNIQYQGGDSAGFQRQSLVAFIYDGQTGAIFTRTPSSWAKIGFFYLVYYSGLAAFFAGMLSIFLYGFTDDEMPSLVGRHSILPQHPAMGFRPQPDETNALIKFDPANNKSYEAHVQNLDDFLAAPRAIAGMGKSVSYFDGQDPEMFRNCSADSPKADAPTSKPCAFDLGEMPEVINECVNQSFGFPAGQPCVAIKINRIIGFVPKLTNQSDQYLKIQCEGLYAADEDNIGQIDYFPKDGIDLWHYPFMGQKHYLSPLVFVKFRNATRNVLVQVVCRPVNADNIVPSKDFKGAGFVKFELFVEERSTPEEAPEDAPEEPASEALRKL